MDHDIGKMRHAYWLPCILPRQYDRAHMSQEIPAIGSACHEVDALPAWGLVVFPCPPGGAGGMVENGLKQLACLNDIVLTAPESGDMGWHGSGVQWVLSTATAQA